MTIMEYLKKRAERSAQEKAKLDAVQRELEQAKAELATSSEDEALTTEA